jgi:hypothetical protein
MPRDCPSVCQNAVNFGECMSGCQRGASCSALCTKEWDSETCANECNISVSVKRARAKTINVGSISVKDRHAYMVPLVAAIVLGVVAWQMRNRFH